MFLWESLQGDAGIPLESSDQKTQRFRGSNHGDFPTRPSDVQ
jgi:hypothetical protein